MFSKFIALFALIAFTACTDGTATPMCTDDDAGLPDSGETEVWRCVGTFTVDGDDFAITNEIAPTYTGDEDGEPAPAVRPVVTFAGCTMTMSLEHGHADASGRFDLELPPWELDASDPDCANVVSPTARVWRPAHIADEAQFYLQDFVVNLTDGTHAEADIVCAPDTGNAPTAPSDAWRCLGTLQETGEHHGIWHHEVLTTFDANDDGTITIDLDVRGCALSTGPLELNLDDTFNVDLLFDADDPACAGVFEPTVARVKQGASGDNYTVVLEGVDVSHEDDAFHVTSAGIICTGTR